MVKVYGAGGFRGLEPYQSGFLISGEGHVLTAWSYVLDTDAIHVTLDDGRKFPAQLLGSDPRLEIAVLKIDVIGVPFFDLSQAVVAEPGARVLAFSNLFGVATGNEPASVQHGSVSVRTTLAARRGAFETPYRGPVYVLDAVTNNPGAAGGVLTNQRGELLAILGKELRNSLNNSWLNYAVPIAEIAATVDRIRAGDYVAKPLDDPQEDREKPKQPLRPELLGLLLVPDVLERTPPYIDAVRPDSPAAAAGLRPDDLVLFLNDRLVQSCKTFRSELEYINRDQSVKLTVIRDQELIEVELQAAVE
jgi:serine protease Do